MTELTYLSNHFFDGSHIRFGINTMPSRIVRLAESF
jgi:hypothetical protein